MTSNKITDNIKQDLEQIGQFIANISYTIEFLKITDTSTGSKYKDVIKTYPFFSRVRFAFWTTVILDLYKLYSPRDIDKFSFHKLINKLINDYSKICFEQKIEKEELHEIQSEISSLELKVNKLIAIRDEYIAHFDRNRGRYSIQIKDVAEILEFSQQIHDKINISLNDSSTYWKFADGELSFHLLHSLYAYRQIDNIIRKYKINNQSSVPISEIENIF